MAEGVAGQPEAGAARLGFRAREEQPVEQLSVVRSVPAAGVRWRWMTDFSNNSGAGGPQDQPPRDRKRSDDAARRQPLEKMFEKPPPHSPEAEMALLGAMILDPSIVHDVVPIIRTPEAFYVAAHVAIYDAIVRMYDQKQSGDLVLLHEELRDKEQLAGVGGAAYLQKLAEETPGPAAAEHFARIIADKYKLRRLINAGGKILYDAYNAGAAGPEGAREVVDAAETLIFEIAQQEESSAAERLNILLDREVQRLEGLQGRGVSGVATGYADLDELTSGLQQGEMIIIAARPSMGKTALALCLAEQVAFGGSAQGPRDGKQVPIAFFSLEMSKSSIAQRMLSARSGLSSHDMRSGRLSEDGYRRLADAAIELEHAPIYIDDTPGLSILGLRTRARRLVAQHGVRAIFIDYLQLMSAPGAAKESRQVEVSAISRGVKALARELEVPVICLSQLNRGPEARGDNRPRMSDLRESGSIEQDADVVMLLHREAYYHVGDRDWEMDNADKLNVAEIIIAKQRNGPTDVVKLVWDAKSTRFKNYGAYPGGTGLSAGYAAPHAATGGHGASAEPPPFDDPFRVPVVTFAPGKKSGPVGNFRDGGGPDKDDDLPV